MTIKPNATVLIIDDLVENLHVLSELLRSNYRVLTAISGEDGMRAANSWPKPDLILLDVLMPGMSGYTVLTKLREDPNTQDMPVVFLTAMAEAEDEEHGLALGAADYITKPIKPAVVLARVRTQLELTHLLRRSGTTPEHADWLDKIDSAGRHLLSIINDILDISKIEAGRLQLESTDFQLSSVLDNVASILGAGERLCRQAGGPGCSLQRVAEVASGT